MLRLSKAHSGFCPGGISSAHPTCSLWSFLTRTGQLPLPFYVYWDPHRKERQLLLIGAGTSDYLDGIFAPECRTEHVTAALDLLAANAQFRKLWRAFCRNECASYSMELL
jgi:hypothetical protein